MSTIDLGPRYDYVRELGRGGAGRVLLVHDRHLDRELALKLLHPTPSNAQSAAVSRDAERLEDEFRLLTGIEHPGIARVHDFGFLRGRPYFTSDYVRGVPLSTLLPVRAAEDLWGIGAGIVEAIAFLHRSGILHLDVKPGNILVPSRNGANADPVLIDFGLFHRGATSSPGPVAEGSLPYMAPEYFRGEPLGPWTDVYALGVTFFQMLTGLLPLQRADETSREPHPSWPLSESNALRAAGRDVEPFVLRCVARDPRARFSSGEELLTCFRRLEPSSPRFVRTRERAKGFVGRERELREIDEFLETFAVAADGPRCAFVVGSRGMGHTRFFREVKTRAQTRGLPCYLETGYPGQHNAPGALLRCLSAHLSSSAKAESREGTRDRWTAFLTRLNQPRRSDLDELLESERRLRRGAEIALAYQAMTKTMVLAVDGLQLWDEVSIALVVDLVRQVQDQPRETTPRLALILGYREEGPALPVLRELTQLLLRPELTRSITLHSLDLAETLELHGAWAQEAATPEARLSVFQRTGGQPRQVVALATRKNADLRDTSSRAPDQASNLNREDRNVLLTLDLLERPTTASELGRILGQPLRDTVRQLTTLRGLQFVEEMALEEGNVTWLSTPEVREIVTRKAAATTRRRAHRGIAEHLVKGKGATDSRVVRALRHFRSANRRREVVRYGFRAAHYLKHTFQTRQALEVCRWVLEALPRNESLKRLAGTVETVELLMRVGNFDEGIDLLREQFLPSSKLPKGSRARLLLLLATLHSRKGDYRRAEALFEEGLELSAGKAAALERQDYLRFLNEQAAVKTLLGRREEALQICADGLQLAGKQSSAAVKAVALNLYATRASLALRLFRFSDAIADFEKALSLAETLGSFESQALLLNNLASVRAQQDEYTEAIEAYQSAEKVCLRLDAGPSLVSLYGNLAILCAKVGERESSERYLQEAARLHPESLGKRQLHFFEHARGLCRIYSGRYGAARKYLEVAIRLGENMGDRYVVSFDRVYLAEALLFEGKYASAKVELERLCKDSTMEPIIAMALARLALLRSLLNQPAEVDLILPRYEEIQSGVNIPFLRSWNAVFLGWALAIAGKHDLAAEYLDTAKSYFEHKGLKPGAALVASIRFETEVVLRPLETVASSQPTERSSHDFAAALDRLVEARLLLAAPGAGAEGFARCSDLLAEAGSYLIGNDLPEWNLRLETLRQALLRDTPPEASVTARTGLVQGLPAEFRRPYLESSYWKVWTSGFSVPASWRKGVRASNSAVSRSQHGTKTVTHRDLRGQLATRSRATRRLGRLLDRLRRTEAAVVIVGETGAGKELVARIIHDESARGAFPFQIIDCATVPEGLLESELFGATAGAFTDQSGDRTGILAAAEGGTVLVDAITSADTTVQAKLLRVLSEGTFRPIGSTQQRQVDTRFIFTTPEPLEDQVRQGRLREDLFHRINGVTVEVPPLRERPEDLPALVNAFLREGRRDPEHLKPDGLEYLLSLPWPGNVRELRNIILRLCVETTEQITRQDIRRVLEQDGVQTATVFPRNILAQSSLPELQVRLEKDFLRYHFRRLHGETKDVCEFLGIGRRQFYRRCERLGIRLREERNQLE